MSRRNPGSGEAPSVALTLANALEEKLGRPSYVRRVKNQDQWWITDPMFSFVQHGLRKGATGYRVGYRLSESGDLYFELAHSPVMAQLFKKNLSLLSVVHAATATAPLRSCSFLQWSSRSARNKGLKWDCIDESKLSEFLIKLQTFDEDVGFVSDLFPRIENQKTGIGTAKWAGNDFRLLLAERTDKLSRKRLTSAVDSTWPLLLCLYPMEPIEQRIASLARNLHSAKLAKVCEYARIKRVPSVVSKLCRGEIEGAHIKPHSIGGSDRLGNGLWLCQYHHRETEGRLAGSRTLDGIDVTFG